MNPKFFTVEEANRLIGQLESTFDRIRRNKQHYLWLRGEIEILRLIVDCGADQNNPDAIEAETKRKKLKHISVEIERDIASINETGCILRDVDQGIVDFYSIQNNSVVFLCWKKGEDSILFWHGTDEGFKNRQPLTRSSSK